MSMTTMNDSNTTGPDSPSALPVPPGVESTTTPSVGDTGSDRVEPAVAAQRAFSQADVDRIVATRLREEREKAQRETERKRLEEQGEYQKLLEKEREEREALQAKLQQIELDALKSKVASRHKLPVEIGSRLRGSTEEELESDALELAKTLQGTVLQHASPPPTAPNPTSNRGGPSPVSSTRVPAWSDIFKAG